MTQDAFWKLCREVKADGETIVEGYFHQGLCGGYSCWSYIMLYPSSTLVRRYLNVSKYNFEREVAKYNRWLVTYVTQIRPKYQGRRRKKQ